MTDEQIAKAYCDARGWRYHMIMENGDVNYAIPGVFTIAPMYFPIDEARLFIESQQQLLNE